MDHEQKAHWLFEHPDFYPGLPRRASARVRLRAWCCPAFTAHRCWAVIETGNGLFLRRVVWDRHRAPLGEPVTYGCEVPLERRVHDALLRDLRVVELPPFLPVAATGIDGVTYGVEAGEAITYGASARLVWWHKPPEGWEPLAEWHTQATATFEALLPASTVR